MKAVFYHVKFLLQIISEKVIFKYKIDKRKNFEKAKNKKQNK